MKLNEKIIVNGIEIDINKVNTLLQWLVINEKKNLKTKEKTDSQMVKLIQKKIEEITECY